MNFGVERMVSALAQLGNPQNSIPSIHVVGTNGKGSVVKIVSTLLQDTEQLGPLQIGTFQSPYLLAPNDAICMNGVAIPFILYENYKAEIRTQFPLLSAFELDTVTAFVYFEQFKVDFMIIEAGLGGLLDATNVLKNPLLTLLTTVHLDHENIIGPTVKQILQHKLGVARSNTPFLIASPISTPLEEFGQQRCLLEDFIEQEVAKRGAKCCFVEACQILSCDDIYFQHFQYESAIQGEAGVSKKISKLACSSIDAKKSFQIKTRLLGPAQAANVALAVAAFEFIVKWHLRKPM
jgi:dihydrofolate synthase / folylpolyglutamate synthase